MKATPFMQLRLILLGLIPLVLISPAWSYTKAKQEVSDLKTRNFLTQLSTDTPKTDLYKKDIPTPETFQQVLKEAYETFKGVNEGKNADYIPFLAKADPNLFGIVIATVDGKVYEIGDSKYPFSMQSVSKVFTFAHVLQTLGSTAVEEKIGVNATGLPFNSLIAIELNETRSVNPLVNAGAITTVSFVPGNTPEDRWNQIIGTMSDFAGRPLSVQEEVYRSESETNLRNRGIVQLLDSYKKLGSDPLESLDLYTRQCSIEVTARDLALMSATLANGGVNPITSKRVLAQNYVPKVLAVMLTNGLYEDSGTWAYQVGLPAKSGVSGGIIAVVPGKFAIATYSPPLDQAGNSFRGQKAIEYITSKLGVNIFSGATSRTQVASYPKQGGQ
ncbi:MAG: glutaminase A [Brasilonema octagenarum HA4186-MV1]|jgi:glutaminase|nr:glutaminase A [Brasilonema sennae]MBW4626417.1 glutaminase A [Brasilonema octagenarum HA4186-MV1]